MSMLFLSLAFSRKSDKMGAGKCVKYARCLGTGMEVLPYLGIQQFWGKFPSIFFQYSRTGAAMADFCVIEVLTGCALSSHFSPKALAKSLRTSKSVSTACTAVTSTAYSSLWV